MKNIFDKIFFKSGNFDNIGEKIQNLTKKTPVRKIFETLNSFSEYSEVRYVGGCIRQIINNENVNDIDLATNLNPYQVCEALKKENIQFYETGKEHGTITAVIDEKKYEITSLREDISTDGRHAKVLFSQDWKKDSLRRDFTINSIYSDKNGNLFDPNGGKKDLEKGLINFIGKPEVRIKEDYLRILRYLRFFQNYSKKKHDPDLIRKLKINIGGVSKLSKERLLNELEKMMKIDTLEKLTNDPISVELIQVIFPELKNIKIFSKLGEFKKKLLKKIDFVFLLSLAVVDGTDNTDYFIFKYNISKKDQKRIKVIDNFFKEKINFNTFTEKNLKKFFYFNGHKAISDILIFKFIKTKKIDKNLLELNQLFLSKKIPKMPINADILISKYKIPEGKQIGLKLKKIEDEWINNNFQISDKQIENLIKN
tara:strand:- start:114 stop:1388 length:1275 start_codon:yes stop_codon:yes gene_type:complete